MRRAIITGVLTLVALMLVVTVGNAGDRKWQVSSGDSRRAVRGSGDYITEEMDLDEFDRIEIDNAANINITFGERQSVQITFDDNLIDMVDLDVRRGRLQIGNDGDWKADRAPVIDIVMKELKHIRINGAADFNIEGFNGDYFEYELRGAGDLQISGMVNELEINLHGAGNVDARDLIAQDVIANLNGTGNIKVHAEESFDGALYGVGKIEYWGELREVRRTSPGMGRIRKRG